MMLVDRRIGSGEFFHLMKDRLNGQAKKTTLNSADFAFEGNGPEGPVFVGIERKSLWSNPENGKFSDFITSIRGSRFQAEQLPKLQDDYQFIYLLVEGLFRPSSDGVLEVMRKGKWAPYSDRGPGCLYAEFDRFLAGLEVRKGVMVLRSASQQESVEMVLNRYRWWQKDWDDHHSLDAVKTPGTLLGKASHGRIVASTLPRVGWAMSREVIKKFPTMGAQSAASIEDWKSVKWVTKEGRNRGIGDKTAKEIYEAIHGK